MTTTLTWRGRLALMIFAGLAAHGADARAAVAPNNHTGNCGPYYIWYQATPDAYPPSIDSLDLCEITFDISDVVDDFDFVYFSDTAASKRAALDQNKDGISDLFFAGRTQNYLKWRPNNGCMHIDLHQCQGRQKGVNEQCGYAMISVQPKAGFTEGSASISIGVNAKCPPDGVDCSRTFSIEHQYADCVASSTPDFVVQHVVAPVMAQTFGQQEAVNYTINVQYTGDSAENHTVLTNAIEGGTKGGSLKLVSLKVDCPIDSNNPAVAICEIINFSVKGFEISMANLPMDKTAVITYSMLTQKNEIEKDEYSYFTNTAKLSTGGSAMATVGVRGTREKEDEIEAEPTPREERPASGGQQRR